MSYCWRYYTGHLHRFFISQKTFTIEYQKDTENEYLMLCFYKLSDIFQL